jgi:hypothetical protein
MPDVPSSPVAFFTSYLPAQFAALGDKVAGKSSPYAISIAVPDAGAWTLRLEDGKLVIKDGADPEALLTLTLRESDFDTLFAESARLASASAPSPESHVFAWKALGVDAQKAKLVRAIPGSMAFVVTDGETSRKLLVTPQGRTPNLETPECRLECKMDDFREMQAGKQQPLQLIMAGKMKIVGNAQIPMALSTILA